MLRHNLVVNRSPGDNVDRQRKDAVGSQESFRYRNSAVRGVVQRPLKPLIGGGIRGIAGTIDDVAGKRYDSLAAHRVTLVCHGGGTDLSALERFVEFLHMRHQTQIDPHLARALRDAAEYLQNKVVNLA